MSYEQAQQIDAISDDFESEWLSGRRLDIEQYLAQAPQLPRQALLTELLIVELDIHVASSESFDLGSYLRRFPANETSVRRAFEHFNARNAGSSSDNPDEIEQNGRLGKFRILGKLGEGSFGKVYKAFDQRLSRVVAIKVLHDRFSDGPYDIDYFMREARAAAQFQHPNICTIYDADCVDSRHYIAMAFIDGNSLQEILRDRGHFGPRHAAQVIRDLAGAVHQAHVVPSSKLGSRRSRSLLSFIVGQTDQSLFFVFNP